MLIRTVLTGGPCAGKSTTLVTAYERMTEAGCTILTGQEVATRILGSGVKPHLMKGARPDSYFELQKIIFEAQIAEEDWLERLIAKLSGAGPKVLLFDRGVLDTRAYCSPEEFEEILRAHNLTLPDLFDRYDRVFHLITAANGAEDYYTLSNNAARSESIEEVMELDVRTQEAWLGHPSLVIIDNSTDFEEKIGRFLSAFYRSIGIPVPTQLEYKFLLSNPPKVADLPKFEEFDIEQAYLPDVDGAEYRVRRRIHAGIPFYTRTFKIPTESPHFRIRREERISEREFNRLLSLHLFPDRDTLRKRRFCFLHDNQYFRLDVFLAPDYLRGRAMLEIEPTEENDSIRIPSFCGSALDVTADMRYTNRVLYEHGFPTGRPAPKPTRSRRGWRFWHK